MCTQPHTGYGTGQQVEVADIFRTYGAAYQQRHRLSGGQRRVMQDVMACRTAVLGQDLVGSVAAGALQEYKQGNKANRRTPELCCPSVECRRLSSRAWLPIAISFAETRGLPTSAVILLGSF